MKISEVLGYEAIDIHSHLDHGVDGDRSTIVSPDQRTVHKCELDFLKEGYDRVGICCGAFSTFASLRKPESLIAENEYVHQLALDNDWVYQWVALDPRQDGSFAQAERMMAHGKVLGIKIHPWHGYDLLEWGDKIFSFADELGAVVLMHNVEVPRMPEFANKYRNMKLIVAHIGSEDHIDAIANARHGNIYVDTSGGASNLNNVIEHAVERVGADNILFGTDTYSPAFQMGRIAWAGISEYDKRKILRENAERLFGKVFERF